MNSTKQICITIPDTCTNNISLSSINVIFSDKLMSRVLIYTVTMNIKGFPFSYQFFSSCSLSCCLAIIFMSYTNSKTTFSRPQKYYCYIQVLFNNEWTLTIPSGSNNNKSSQRLQTLPRPKCDLDSTPYFWIDQDVCHIGPLAGISHFIKYRKNQPV